MPLSNPAHQRPDQRLYPRRPRAIPLTLQASRRDARLRLAIWALACLAALMATMLLAPRANAQVFSSQPYVAAPDPAVEQLRIRLEALEADLRKAVDQAETLGAQLGDARRLAEQADAGRRRAEAEIETLKDRVETLEDMISSGAVAQDDAALTSAPQGAPRAPQAQAAAPAPPAAPAVELAALPQDEEGLFQESHGMLIGGNFAGAEAAFDAYLAKYPKGKKAADAQYYLGEALLYQDNYPDAAAAYGKLIKDFPSSSNAPTGLVKLARAMRLMDKKTEACRTLDLMNKQFPKASAVAKQMAAQERQNAKCS